ncbi:hypothetical protein FNH22_07025 [Fulvivirga sp. M361]|uniref:YciI family protein n=1 Tax=Fulvivirga sp. M361 TaxID=2594266 RepID=UPI00117B77C2|nr:YciI family protein [Fulvivirga sp. M361]TRX60786.1 hypothetical protein FNH22_07025 [Fulvivirga sp. M361]
MKEFITLAYPDGTHLGKLSTKEKQQHIDDVMAYLEDLDRQGKIKSAEPLADIGRQIIGKKGEITDGPFVETKETVAGFFHILAKDMEKAISIAKANPMFNLEEGGRLEVRPMGIINKI